MTRYMSSPELKASAKMRLRPVRNVAVSATAIYYGLTFMIQFSASLLPVKIAPLPAALLTVMISFLSAAVSGTLGAGYQYMFLKLYCRRPVASGDVFYALQQEPKKVLPLSCIMAALSVLPMLPFSFFVERYMVSMDTADISLAFFCLTPALILTTFIELIYSQIYYLMLDFPAYQLRDLFRRSRLLMRGQKGRLFYIIVSFLPLKLLGIITCGVGLLWIYPYMQAVKTEFYLDIVSKKQS